MLKTIFLTGALVLLANILSSSAGRTHYYGGSGYPKAISYNSYAKPYGYYGSNGYGYGSNDYGVGYDGYQDYNDDDYDVDNYGYDTYGDYQNPYGSNSYAYGGYQQPYRYQKQALPVKLIGSPVVNEYVAPLPPISKSVTTSSLYQTHPTGYGNDGYAGNYGYAGGYGYAPKYGSVYGNGYYRK